MTAGEWLKAEGGRLGIDLKATIIPRQYDPLLTTNEWIENEAKRLRYLAAKKQCSGWANCSWDWNCDKYKRRYCIWEAMVASLTTQ